MWWLILHMSFSYKRWARKLLKAEGLTKIDMQLGLILALDSFLSVGPNQILLVIQDIPQLLKDTFLLHK